MAPRPRELHDTPLAHILDAAAIPTSRLAEAMGWATTSAQDYVKGKRSLARASLPTLRKFQAALAALGVAVAIDALAGDATDPAPTQRPCLERRTR